MIINIQDEDYSVTIESAEDAVTITQAVEMFRGALVGIGYHPDSVSAHVPTDEELDEMISDILNSI
jgi:anthranilate/para-aminobenzoate synthase component II